VEAEFTGSPGTFARASNAKNGIVRRGTMRNRSEPGQVVRAGFEPGRIAVAKRYWLLLRISTDGRLWRKFKNKKLSLPKEKRRKAEQNERLHREEHDDKARRVKNFRASAMLKTTPPGCERKAT
jgi:hypothetical protein